MKFSLIICGYNEESNLDICISSCLAQNYERDQYEVIYVDNNSKDNSLNIAKQYPIKVLSEQKQGLSEARNCGIENSVGEILIFLDADLRLDLDYLKNHEKTFISTNVGAGGGKVLPLVQTWISDYLGVSLLEGYPRFVKDRFVKTYPGCNLSIRRDVIKKVGGFKEGLISSSGITRFAEDKEMCERIRQNGFLIYYNSSAIVYHKNTFLFKTLFNVWSKGSKGRLNMIKLGKTDPLSLVFKFNIPILFFVGVIIIFITNPIVSLFLISISFFVVLLNCIKSFIKTRMFLQNFLIKPWMDVLSVLVVNFFVFLNRLKK